MSELTSRTREVFETGLRNQHAVENQAIALLERQLGRLENYPAMAKRMQEHLEESKEQARRLEQLLSGLGTSSSVVKDLAMSTVGNLAALMHTPAHDEVLKNTFANFAFEHYEIAAYKSLLTLADLTGQPSAISMLERSLAEEEAMAKWIADHLEETTTTFVRRTEAGETAGV
jgi:ferritin-like metal-binding protein YciE